MEVSFMSNKHSCCSGHHAESSQSDAPTRAQTAFIGDLNSQDDAKRTAMTRSVVVETEAPKA